MPTLFDIQQKVRKVTGRYNSAQLTDAQINKYINTFYTEELPENIRTLKLKVPYVFTTIPNVDTYNLPFNSIVDVSVDPNNTVGSQAYVSIQPPAYCAGYQMRYFQDKSLFYQKWPKTVQLFQINSGGNTVLDLINYAGVPAFYMGIAPFSPMLRAQVNAVGVIQESAVYITAQQSGISDTQPTFTFLATDVPQNGTDFGLLVSDNIDSSFDNASYPNPMNTINYITGEYQFVLTNTGSLPLGIPINIQAKPYQPSRPVDMLFDNYQITLRPVPADIYQIEIQAFKLPTQLLIQDSPELYTWWQYLALGAAKLVYTDFPDPEGLQYVLGLLQEQMQLVQRQTLKQLSNQRAQTIFSTPGRGNYPGYFYGPGGPF